MGSDKQSRYLREAIKFIMNQKGLRYADLAKQLELSLPTIKRMMTRESLSIERLVRISACLGTEFYDLMALAKSLQEDSLEHLTLEQEAFLVRSPHACRFLIEIMNFQTPSQIAKKFGLSRQSVSLYLNDLQKVGLIFVKDGELVKVAREVLRGPRPDGPLRTDLAKRFRKFVPEMLALELDREITRQNENREPVEQTIAINGYNLTVKSKLELLQALKDLRTKFAEIERLEAQTIDPGVLQSVTFVTLLCEGSVYARAYGEIKNRS